MIVPTILTDNLKRLKKDLAFLKEKVERVQIDIVDKTFASQETIMPSQVMGLTDVDDHLFLDFHLMVKEPVAYVEKDLPGATDFVIGQIEGMDSQVEFCRQTGERGFRPGLAVDLETPLDRLEEMALDLSEQVLVLSVKAGRSGQKFSPAAIKKIENLRRWREREHWHFLIGVDGGINEENISLCRQAGADIFYVGAAIWKAENPKEEIKKLERLMQKI